jgi:hypothetical protein
MVRSQPLRLVAPTAAQDYLAHYRRDGYAIVRSFFSADEIAGNRRSHGSALRRGRERTGGASGTEISFTT